LVLSDGGVAFADTGLKAARAQAQGNPPLSPYVLFSLCALRSPCIISSSILMHILLLQDEKRSSIQFKIILQDVHKTSFLLLSFEGSSD
jgi:hypothetical protein